MVFFNLVEINLIIFTWISSIEATHHLPPYIKTCHRFDPKVNECLVKSTKLMKPYLIKGIPELNVPSIDPLYVDEINLEQGTSAVNFKATLKNVVIKGLGNYEISQLDFDVPNLQWSLKGTVQPVELHGDYVVNGKILIAPIAGKGTFNATISSCNMTSFQKDVIVKKNGEDYLKTNFFNASIQVGGPNVEMQGLFDGSDELNYITNRVIKDNINELFQEVKPAVDEIITKIIKKTLLAAFHLVPYDELYPPIP